MDGWLARPGTHDCQTFNQPNKNGVIFFLSKNTTFNCKHQIFKIQSQHDIITSLPLSLSTMTSKYTKTTAIHRDSNNKTSASRQSILGKMTPRERMEMFFNHLVVKGSSNDADDDDDGFDLISGMSELRDFQISQPQQQNGESNGRGVGTVLTCILPVTQRTTNRYGTLHGGMIATLVDVVGSAALVCSGNESGVSLEINVTYCNPAKLGSHVCIVAKVVRVGRTIAAIQVDLYDYNTMTMKPNHAIQIASNPSKLIATGRHTKYISNNAITSNNGRKPCSSTTTKATPDTITKESKFPNAKL